MRGSDCGSVQRLVITVNGVTPVSTLVNLESAKPLLDLIRFNDLCEYQLP